MLIKLLTNRNFMLLWCAYGISAMGDHLADMAILARQDALNPDVDITPMQARMTFLLMLPMMILGPLAGALADRVSRRWLMVVADMMRVVLMLAFIPLMTLGESLFGAAWGPFTPLALIGVFAALFGPSRQAMVPSLVHTEELVPANAMISGLGMIATMLAALASGALAERGLIREAFYLDALTFFLSALCVYLISPRRGPIYDTQPHVPEPVFVSVVKGFRYIYRHRRVAELMGVAFVFWFAGAAVRNVIPAVVKEVYEQGYVDIAKFQAWIGLGLIIGALIITVLGNALRSEMAITWSLIGVSIALMGLAGTTLIDMAPSSAHNIGVVCVLVMGIFGSAIIVSYNALLQRIVPNQFRGRVFGILNLATMSGLLIASGSLAIPQWDNLDQWVGYVLLGLSVLLAAVGTLTLVVRLRRGTVPRLYGLYRNLVEFVAKFWWRMQPAGYCTVPREGPIIVTANHACMADPLLLLACCNYRFISFMIAAEYYNLPVLGHFIRTNECIPVRRGENDIGATKTCINRLRKGDALGIFIQGGIRHRSEQRDLKNGVAMLALRTGAKVIPAYIGGTQATDSVVWSLVRRYHARVAFGQPVDLSEFEGRKGQEALDDASAKIFAAIEALAPLTEVDGASD